MLIIIYPTSQIRKLKKQPLAASYMVDIARKKVKEIARDIVFDICVIV